MNKKEVEILHSHMLELILDIKDVAHRLSRFNEEKAKELLGASNILKQWANEIKKGKK